MTAPGDAYFNPVTKSKIVFVTTAEHTGGREIEIDWYVPPGEGLPSAKHIHDAAAGPEPEFFSILEGRAGCRVGAKTEIAAAPHVFAIPCNTLHVHAWNAGSAAMQVRQRITLPKPDMALLRGVERFLETLIALSQQGRANRKGDITNPLQGALTLTDTLLPVTRLAGLPLGVQIFVFGKLAALARRRGYTAYIAPQK